MLTKLLYVAILYSCANALMAQSHYKILEDYVKMNNAGSSEAIEEFIKDYYHPEILEKIDIGKHVEFYQHIQSDFPKLNDIVLETIEESAYKLIVHLKRDDISVITTKVDPADILVVKIDLSREDPDYLERGLGLGALICSIRKED